MRQDSLSQSSAAGVAWNLSDLYQGIDDPQINRDLQTALQRALAFEKAYHGKIDVPGGPSAGSLATAVAELESLSEQMDKPLVFAGLIHAGKSDDPRHGALLAHTREQRTVINKHLIFFDLEWARVPDEAANTLLARPELARYHHYLEHKRAWRPHFLTEPEEKILEDKSITGRAAFVRLFDETMAASKYPFEQGRNVEMLSLQQIGAKLYDADRAVRQAAAQGVTKGHQENARLMTYIFNTLVLDHKSDCELRKFSSPMGPRHLANEINDTVVDAIMTASERHHGTVRRYYALKARLLKVDQLCDYDRYAPIFADLPVCDWPTARRIVEESYQAFSPKAGAIVREFFDKRWIDAEMRPGKRGGAFSSSAVPSVHPYIDELH